MKEEGGAREEGGEKREKERKGTRGRMRRSKPAGRREE